VHDKQENKDDVLSILTHDRLRKFNEIHGTVAGNAHDEIAAAQDAIAAD
jgi:hypothetical protein